MKNFDRKAHWESVYELKDPTEMSWFQAEPVTSLEMITNCGLKLSDPVIDVGGGASVLVDRMIDQDYTDLTVLDISEAALASSRNRLGLKADRVSWVVSDVTTFSADKKFALWHDRAVFHFLTEDEDRRCYIQVLKNALEIGGYLIIASFAIGGPEKCSGLPIVQYDAVKLERELGAGFKLVSKRSEEHLTPAGMLQKFNYFHFVRVNEDES